MAGGDRLYQRRTLGHREEVMSERQTAAETMRDHGIGETDLNELALAVSVPACCSEGCMVEIDGECPHGHPSLLIEIGIV